MELASLNLSLDTMIFAAQYAHYRGTYILRLMPELSRTATGMGPSPDVVCSTELKVLRQSTCIFAAAIKNQITRVSYRITSTITKGLLLLSKPLSQKSSPPPARGPWLPTSNSLHQQPVSSLLSRPWQPCRVSPKQSRDRCAWSCLCESARRWLSRMLQ